MRQRKPATLTDKGKEKQKAELSCCLSWNMLGKLGSWEHTGLGQWARAAWSCEAGGECHPPQHSTTVLRKEKRDLAIDSGLWETPRSYPALAPSLGAQSAPSSTEVLPSSTLRALQEAELSLQDVQDPPESFTAPDPLYNA